MGKKVEEFKHGIVGGILNKYQRYWRLRGEFEVGFSG